MSKHTYAIATQDQRAALSYLQRKLANDHHWLDSEACRDYQTQQRDLHTLNAWCQRWLDEHQWKNLKSAIRAARKRRRDMTGDRMPAKHVTLSWQAWRIVSELAKRDEVTLSQFIEQRHQGEWRDLLTEN